MGGSVAHGVVQGKPSKFFIFFFFCHGVAKMGVAGHPSSLSVFFFNFFYIVSYVNQRLTRGEPLIFEQKM
jgi:hypothetical protein